MGHVFAGRMVLQSGILSPLYWVDGLSPYQWVVVAQPMLAVSVSCASLGVSPFVLSLHLKPPRKDGKQRYSLWLLELQHTVLVAKHNTQHLTQLVIHTHKNPMGRIQPCHNQCTTAVGHISPSLVIKTIKYTFMIKRVKLGRLQQEMQMSQ